MRILYWIMAALAMLSFDLAMTGDYHYASWCSAAAFLVGGFSMLIDKDFKGD